MPTRLNSRSLINVLPNLQPPSEVFRLGDIFNEATRGHIKVARHIFWKTFFGKPFVEIGAVRTRSTSTGTIFARQNAEYSRKRTTEYTGDGGLVYTDSTLGRPNWKLRANPLRGENDMGRIAIRLLLTAAGCLSVAAAQDQPGFVRDTCVKVAPGKGAELEAMLHDVTAKQMRVRIDEGHAAWWLALSAVVPAGP